MKLSFVIPAYNEEKYIGNCLESIFREIEGNPHDIEIIVVNNASTDRTGEIAKSFPGVTVVDEPMKGLVRARHAGYVASSGELIANVDSDTKIPRGWIDRVFSEFTANPDLVALSGPFTYYDLSPWRNFLVWTWYYAAWMHHTIDQIFFKKSAILQGGNFIVKRDAMEKIGGFNLTFDFYGEDTDIAMRIKEAGEVKFTFKLIMHTSARRLNEEGLFVSGWNYAINYFWTIFFKKPYSKEHKDIRG